MAECSESTGIIFTLFFFALSVINLPATTKVSLFAIATFFPESIAEIVGKSPE